MPPSKSQLHDPGTMPRRSVSFAESGLTDEIDPTREIRTLIEQLQSASRDSRSQIRAAEAERDAFAAQLFEAQQKVVEMESRLTEVKALVRERDTAVRDAERQTAAAAEAKAQLSVIARERGEIQRQHDDAVRQREELVSQRDEAIRRRDEASRQRDEHVQKMNDAVRQAQETGARNAEFQKQMLSVRQARDTAQAQTLEVSKTLAETRDKLEEVQDELRSRAGAPDLQTALAAITAERDAALQLTQVAAAEQELLREQLTRQESEAQAQTAALAEAQKELSAVKEAQDAARAREEELARDVAQLRADLDAARSEQSTAAATAELEEAARELATARAQSAAAEGGVLLLEREMSELRQLLDERTAQRAELEAEAQENARRLGEVQGQFEFYARDRDTARHARDEALASLAAVQKQIEKVIRERDHVRQASAESVVALETQIEALRVQVATLEEHDAEGAAYNAKMRELAALLEAGEMERHDLGERLSRQRAESIDLAAQLHTAQDEIKQLTATLGEARMQAKLGGSTSGSRTQVLKTLGGSPASSRRIVPSEGGSRRDLQNGFDVPAAQETINSLRLHYHGYLKNPSDTAPFQALHSNVQALSESARTAGSMAMHRVSAALTGLVHELHHFPEQITPGNLRTVSQSIDFLGTLLRLKDLENIKDPAGSVVYAVEDDPDNSHCIALGLETAGLRTTCLSDPVSALCELAATPCDLMVLDINLPNMSGLELCREIRQFALHRTTPVIFLTGMSSPEHREQSSLSGGNDFLGKPFILCELTLKALTLILKSQLHIA